MKHYYLITDDNTVSDAAVYMESGLVAAIPPFAVNQRIRIDKRLFIVKDLKWDVLMEHEECHLTVLVTLA